MENYIKRLHKALEEVNIDEFGDIVLEVDDSNIIQTEEDIKSLCELFTYNFEYMEPHIILDITRMIFSAIDKGSLEKGLENLVSGLVMIFEKSMEDNNLNMKKEYDSYFYHIICMFVGNYDVDSMIMFGKVVNKIDSQDFKLKLLDILRSTLELNNEVEYIRNEGVLEENIK